MKSLNPLSRCPSPRTAQSGFSLVELMVAVTIGLFITLGLSQIFINMYSTSQSQSSLSQYQENQRLALVMLMNTVELTGYTAGIPTSLTPAVTALPAVTNADTSTFTPGAGIVGTGAGTGTGSTSDTLNVYFQSAGSNLDQIINCQGGSASASTTTTFINSFSINANNQLVCTVTTNGGAPSSALVLANNVTSMSIMYGVDTTNSKTTNAYLTAADVTTGAMWMNIRTVQVTLNFCTANVLNPAAAYTSTCPTTPWVQTINLMSKT